MKLSTIKKIVVKCGIFWEDEAEVDAAIFDDYYIEAATRVIEKKKNHQEFKVTVVMECFEKKDRNKLNKHTCYNTYFVLINAGFHQKAELLRDTFLKSYGIDLQKESIKGDGKLGGN